MKAQLRRVVLYIATGLTAAATLWGAAPAKVAGFNPEQTAPAAGAVPAHPDQPKPLTQEQRADVYMARKSYSDAADYYYRALKQSGFKDPVVWNKLGIAFQEQAKFRSARQAYANSVRVDKNFAEGWNNMATVYYMEKKYSKSVKYYQQAIELKGDDAAFHLNLGTSYFHLKKYDLAVQEYRTALGLDPNVVSEDSLTGTIIHAGASDMDVEYYFFMAKAFASVGNVEEAVHYLRRALEDGFKNTKRIDEDPDLKKISQHPAFVELMRNPPVAIKN